MVVFTCGHCGESVQKPKVEKHYLTKCRNRNPNLSCMDCFKDFLGQDYESHTKCITEEERYSGKGFIAKEKKGEKKQNAWVDLLQSVLDEQTGAPPNVRRIIETISKHNNTPRKKPKFINFVKNVCGHKTNPKDMDQAWDLISVKLSALSVNNQNKNQNGTSEKPVTNGEAKNKTNGVEKDDENGVEKDDENDDDEPENDTNGIENGEEDETEGTAGVEPKKLSKKQQKAEKRRQKYEAELKSATEPPPEDIPEENETKKGKKKKNRSNSTSSGVDEPHEGKNKNKKRKRQDTVNSTVEASDNGTEEVETVIINKTKTLKKKQKTAEEEAQESICLHDQNVAKIEELAVSGDKFNWHAAIMSVLQKKDNELPFKRLQKKVLSEYSEATGRDVDDRIADKFIKKLKSAPNVRVDKNRVTLID